MVTWLCELRKSIMVVRACSRESISPRLGVNRKQRTTANHQDKMSIPQNLPLAPPSTQRLHLFKFPQPLKNSGHQLELSVQHKSLWRHIVSITESLLSRVHVILFPWKLYRVWRNITSTV